MKLKELRELRLVDRAKMNYIFLLIKEGAIKGYVSAKGYRAYDEDEYEQYKATVKRGRPLK